MIFKQFSKSLTWRHSGHDHTGHDIKLSRKSKQLLERTEKLALLSNDGDHSWLEYPSIIASRAFMAPINKDKVRASDGTPECTHAIETADLAVNTASKELIETWGKEAIAYIMYHHDTFENSPYLSIRKTVFDTWKGDPKQRTAIIEMLELMTDTPGLSSDQRKKEQIKRANAEPTGLIAHLRLCDKFCPLYRDNEVAKKGYIPFGGDKKGFFRYIQRCFETVYMIRNASMDLKKKYYILIAETKFRVSSIKEPKTPHMKEDPLMYGSCVAQQKNELH